jgi:uncharacterized protein
VRYWDSSALVALVVEEEASAARRQLLGKDPVVITWWGSRVECASAIQRLNREGHLNIDDVAVALHRLDLLARGWAEIEPREQVRRRAMRLLRIHSLRAADAFQLAAALAACRDEPSAMPMVCSATRLSEAARSEGFVLL